MAIHAPACPGIASLARALLRTHSWEQDQPLQRPETICHLSVGTEADEECYKMASVSIPLADMYPEFRGNSLEDSQKIQKNVPENQNIDEQLVLGLQFFLKT